MNNKIKLEVLKTMAEAGTSAVDRHEIRQRLEAIHKEELRLSARRKELALWLIFYLLIGILFSVLTPLLPSERHVHAASPSTAKPSWCTPWTGPDKTSTERPAS